MDTSSAQRVGIAFETLLLSSVLKPLAAGFDNALGDYGTSVIAQSIAEHDRNGFGALIARSVERD